MTGGEVWRRFRRNRLAVVGLAVVAVVALAALLAPVVTTHSPTALGPSSRAGPSGRHWFGTDVVGRDLFARVVYGARVSLRVGILGAAAASAIGLAVGGVAGLYRGVIDGLLMRAADVLLSFPYLLAALVLVAVVGPGEGTVILALALLAWVPVARLFRAGVLQLREAPHVEAARAAGCADRRLLLRHILPHAIAPVVVYGTLLVGTAVLTEAGLSFLGVGVTEPTPSWGLMVNQGRTWLFTAPHLLFFPSAAIVVTVMAFVLVGDGLRDALDPRYPEARWHGRTRRRQRGALDTRGGVVR